MLDQPFLQEEMFSSNTEAPLLQKKRTGTFVDNMKLPIHRWYRYSAGFSSEWVKNLLVQERYDRGDHLILDPFAGSGTTMLSAAQIGIPSIGVEAHPFVHKIASAKLCWGADKDFIRKSSNKIISIADSKWQDIKLSDQPSLLLKCYSEFNLKKLESLRLAYSEYDFGGVTNESQIIWLAITSILRECSFVGTAQWQYVLPNKTKLRVLDPFDAFAAKIELFIKDMGYAVSSGYSHNAKIYLGDSRQLEGIEKGSVSRVITSPPYPNNYDYADSTRLELTFWREVKDWGGLHEIVRKKLITSCSQHSAKNGTALEKLLDDPLLSPIKSEIVEVCESLAIVRMQKGGKKTYHTMIATYFIDMARSLKSLREVCKEGSKMCFVIGDSAPYGVYVPVDLWIERLAIEYGFEKTWFEKIRDRNTKWKNRKHDVPLKEGNLWIEG